LFALLNGRLDFFRKLGAALSSSPNPRSDHEVAHTLVNYWLTRFLWLMDNKTLADAVRRIHGINCGISADRVKHAKRRWELFSIKPALVVGLEDNWEMKFSRKGESLLVQK